MSKKLFIVNISFVLAMGLLSSCSTENANTQSHYLHSGTASNLIPSPTAVSYSPANVKLYSVKNPPKESYDEIAVIQVEFYSEYGIRRQEAQMNQIIKEQASTLGGNAVIVSDDAKNKCVNAKIIRIS